MSGPRIVGGLPEVKRQADQVRADARGREPLGLFVTSSTGRPATREAAELALLAECVVELCRNVETQGEALSELRDENARLRRNLEKAVDVLDELATLAASTSSEMGETREWAERIARIENELDLAREMHVDGDLARTRSVGELAGSGSGSERKMWTARGGKWVDVETGEVLDLEARGDHRREGVK